MLKKIAFLLVALSTVFGTLALAPQQAEARRGGVVAGAVVGGIVAGALIAGAARGARAEPACYRGPRRCDYVGRQCFYNRFGDYVCRGGDYRCWRPTICD